MEPTNSVEVKSGTEVMNGAPEKLPQEVPVQSNPLAGTLDAAVQGMVEQIRQCDEQADRWMKRKAELQSEVNEVLAKIQKQVNAPVAEKKTAAPKKVSVKPRVDKNSSIPALIRKFLEANGPARTRDIRKFLLSCGRNTNPGVSLSRMVESGDLKHVDRGVYKIA